MQRGSGFGALAMAIGGVALPLAWKFIGPAAKTYWKRITCSSSSRIIIYSNQEENAETSFQKHSKKHNQKQNRTGRSTSRMRSRERKTTTKRNTKVLIPKKRTPLRSRSNFFTKVRNDF